jgi:hypothetical protein
VKFGIVIPSKAILLLQLLYRTVRFGQIVLETVGDLSIGQNLIEFNLTQPIKNSQPGAICIKFTNGDINRYSFHEAVRRNLDPKQTIIGMITPVEKVYSIWLVSKYYG